MSPDVIRTSNERTEVERLRDTVEQLRQEIGRLKAESRHSHETGAVDPNPLDTGNHYFRKCLKGHVNYAVSFAECPSCKIERERGSEKALEPRDSCNVCGFDIRDHGPTELQRCNAVSEGEV